MKLSSAPRRPYRVAAVALLAALHIAAIWSFIHLGTTRERANERLVQLIMLALKRPARAEIDLPTRPVQPPRPLVAPLPPVEVEQLSSVPVAASPIATPAPGGAAASGAAASGAAAGGAAAGGAAASGAAAEGTPAPPGPAKLDLTIPKDFYAHPPPLTPAQEAMRDPRSNHLELTKQEKLDIAFGIIECVAWQREPDGSIYRGPGHFARIQGINANPFTRHKPGTEDRGQECVK